MDILTGLLPLVDIKRSLFWQGLVAFDDEKLREALLGGGARAPK